MIMKGWPVEGEVSGTLMLSVIAPDGLLVGELGIKVPLPSNRYKEPLRKSASE